MDDSLNELSPPPSNDNDLSSSSSSFKKESNKNKNNPSLTSESEEKEQYQQPKKKAKFSLSIPSSVRDGSIQKKVFDQVGSGKGCSISGIITNITSKNFKAGNGCCNFITIISTLPYTVKIPHVLSIEEDTERALIASYYSSIKPAIENFLEDNKDKSKNPLISSFFDKCLFYKENEDKISSPYSLEAYEVHPGETFRFSCFSHKNALDIDIYRGSFIEVKDCSYNIFYTDLSNSKENSIDKNNNLNDDGLLSYDSNIIQNNGINNIGGNNASKKKKKPFVPSKFDKQDNKNKNKTKFPFVSFRGDFSSVDETKQDYEYIRKILTYYSSEEFIKNSKDHILETIKNATIYDGLKKPNSKNGEVNNNNNENDDHIDNINIDDNDDGDDDDHVNNNNNDDDDDDNKTITTDKKISSSSSSSTVLNGNKLNDHTNDNNDIISHDVFYLSKLPSPSEVKKFFKSDDLYKNSEKIFNGLKGNYFVQFINISKDLRPVSDRGIRGIWVEVINPAYYISSIISGDDDDDNNKKEYDEIKNTQFLNILFDKIGPMKTVISFPRSNIDDDKKNTLWCNPPGDRLRTTIKNCLRSADSHINGSSISFNIDDNNNENNKKAPYFIGIPNIFNINELFGYEDSYWFSSAVQLFNGLRSLIFLPFDYKTIEKSLDSQFMKDGLYDFPFIGKADLLYVRNVIYIIDYKTTCDWAGLRISKKFAIEECIPKYRKDIVETDDDHVSTVKNPNAFEKNIFWKYMNKGKNRQFLTVSESNKNILNDDISDSKYYWYYIPNLKRVLSSDKSYMSKYEKIFNSSLIKNKDDDMDVEGTGNNTKSVNNNNNNASIDTFDPVSNLKFFNYFVKNINSEKHRLEALNLIENDIVELSLNKKLSKDERKNIRESRMAKVFEEAQTIITEELKPLNDNFDIVLVPINKTNN